MVFLSLQKSSFQGEVDNTSYKREFETSPVFIFSNTGTIGTTAELILDFASLNSQTEKYSPFNILTVHNTSTVKIKVFPNQDRTKSFVIPSGTSRTFTQDQIRFIRSLIIENQYGIGDKVKIGSFEGKVIKITMRSTVLKDEEGKLYYMSNGSISNVTNLSQQIKSDNK